MKVPAYVELYKAHPRTPIDRIGRVRAKLKNSDEGSPTNSAIPTKKELLRQVGRQIPQLKSYEARKKLRERKEAELFKNLVGKAPITNSQKNEGGRGGNNKKKNKKKRR